MKEKLEKTQDGQGPAKYYGRQLIAAAIGIDRDVLSAVLQLDKLYTQAEADAAKEDFLSKELR